MRKFIALLLTGILTMTAFPVWAAEAGEAAAELGKYGIMNGDPDGNLRLGDTISRAEFAKMSMTAKDGKAYAPTNTVFTDVPSSHWASGYIMKATEYKILNGMGNGTFAPDENVTEDQAVKMVVCALGYGGLAEELGGYPSGYYTVADRLGIWDKNSSDGLLTATRGEVAVLLEKALDVPMRDEKKIFYFDQTGRLNSRTEATVFSGTDGTELKTFRIGLESKR